MLERTALEQLLSQTLEKLEVTKSVDVSDVKGLGFDATCSLVVLDRDGKPLAINHDGENERNVIMWMDHRAWEEAEVINRTRHDVLKYVGGKISLEMEIPKILWIKQNLPETWQNVGHFFDLPDFLTWKATGSLSRSVCSLACKFCFQANDQERTWNDDFLCKVGLVELTQYNHQNIGNVVLNPGEPCGQGLTHESAADLDLNPGTAVGTSVVDAYAGCLGTLGCSAGISSIDGGSSPPNLDKDKCVHGIETRLAMICGTSTCHMALSKEPLFCNGIWGPYYSTMIAGYWNNEAGQSVAGKLIDYMIETHPALPQLKDISRKSNKTLYDTLSDHLKIKAGAKNIPIEELTKNVHVWPDFHGNRSPVADSTLCGMISGLTLCSGLQDLAALYLAVIQALAYGTRHIIESLEASGHSIKGIYACGGLSKNQLYIQTHSNITGLPVILPDKTESVLLGAAMLGAQACKYYTSEQVLEAMGGTGSVVWPQKETFSYHEKKYKVFKNMLEHQKLYREIMNN